MNHLIPATNLSIDLTVLRKGQVCQKENVPESMGAATYRSMGVVTSRSMVSCDVQEHGGSNLQKYGVVTSRSMVGSDVQEHGGSDVQGRRQKMARGLCHVCTLVRVYK